MRALKRAPSSSLVSTWGQWGPPMCRNCCCAVHRTTAVALLPSPALTAIAASLLFLSPAQAHIAIEQLPQPQQEQRQPVIPGSSAGFDPAAVGQIRGGCAAACLTVHQARQAHVLYLPPCASIPPSLPRHHTHAVYPAAPLSTMCR